MPTNEKLKELVQYVAKHVTIVEGVNSAGEPWVKISFPIDADGTTRTVKLYDGKVYKPGADFFVDLGAAVRCVQMMDQSPEMVKERQRGASVKDKVR